MFAGSDKVKVDKVKVTSHISENIFSSAFRVGKSLRGYVYSS